MLSISNLQEGISDKSGKTSKQSRALLPDGKSTTNNQDLKTFMPDKHHDIKTQNGDLRKIKSNMEPHKNTRAENQVVYSPPKDGEVASARGSYDFLNRNSSFNIDDLRAGRSVQADQRNNSADVIQEYEEQSQKVQEIGKEASDNSSLIQQERVYQQYDYQITSKQQIGKASPGVQPKSKVVQHSMDLKKNGQATFSPTAINSPKFKESANLVENTIANSGYLKSLSTQVPGAYSAGNRAPQSEQRQYTQPITPNYQKDKDAPPQSYTYSKQRQQAMQNRQLVYTASNHQQASSKFGGSTGTLPRQAKATKQHRRLLSAQVTHKAGGAVQSLHSKKVSERRTAVASASGKSMTHDKRMSLLANQKLSELLVFDEGNMAFRIQQPTKRSRAGTQCSAVNMNQNFDHKSGSQPSQNQSRFSKHTTKRAENLEKQQIAYSRLLNESNERNSYLTSGANMPRHLSRSSVSKMIVNRNSSSLQKALLGQQLHSQKHLVRSQLDDPGSSTGAINGSKLAEIQMSDYDFQKTHTLLHGARAKHELYLAALRRGAASNTVIANQFASGVSAVIMQTTNSVSGANSQTEINYVPDREIFNKLAIQNLNAASRESVLNKLQEVAEQHSEVNEHSEEPHEKHLDIHEKRQDNYIKQLSPNSHHRKMISEVDFVVDTKELQESETDAQFQASPEMVKYKNSQLMARLSSLQESQENALLSFKSKDSAKRGPKDQEALTALKVDQDYRRSKSPNRKKEDVRGLLTSAQKLSLLRMSRRYLQGGGNQIKGIDTDLLDDDLNYKPSTEYSVTLNFKKEFIRHKQIICSIKEFNNFDIQNKWDIGYSKTFCHNGKNSGCGQSSMGVDKNARDTASFSIEALQSRYQRKESNNPQYQTEGEKQVNLVSKHSYFENYELEEEIKDSVGKIVLQLGQTQAGGNMRFLRKESTLFNTHTRELVEGYLSHTNEAGVSLCDFEDQMVLRFKNDQEIGLYFDTVDQLSQVIILKGRRVLLEKEHYGEIMEKFIDLNKNFMLFLCKDEDYGDIISQQDSRQKDIRTESKDMGNMQHARDDISKYLKDQERRFAKRDADHRSFIRAFLFDYIFKTFIQILDECISQRERLLTDKQEEWAYYSDKKCNQLDSEVTSMMKQIANLRAEHKTEQQNYETRIEKLKEEQRELQLIIQDYKMDLAHLKNFESRTDEIGALRNHLRDTTELIIQAEEEMGKQREAIVPVLNMINVIAHEPGFKDASTQSDCQIGCYNAHLNSGLNPSSLAELAETSISRLQGIMSQVRVAAYNEEEQEDEAEALRTKKQARSGSRSKSSAKGKKPKGKAIKRAPTVILEGSWSKIIEDHEKVQITLDELKQNFDGYMDSFHKQNHSSLNDFVCSKIVLESEGKNILEAAQRMDKYIQCLTKDENSDHPYVLLLSKIIGFNGYKAMGSAELSHFIELRDSLQRDAGSAAGDEVMLYKAVEFARKHFKANKPLLISIITNLHLYAQSALQQKMGLASISEIVKKDSFQFPSEMSEVRVKDFFSKHRKADPLYLWKLSFVILNFLAQLKANRKDVEQLFKHETKEGFSNPRKSEFMSVIKEEACLGNDDLELLWTFIDPNEEAKYNDKFKADVSNFVNFCKLPQTLSGLKVRISQVVFLNCIYDKIHQYIDNELPQTLEHNIRKQIGVEIALPFSVSAELPSPKQPPGTENPAEQAKAKKKPVGKKSKKKQSLPGELCYHTEYQQVEKCYNALIEKANIREKRITENIQKQVSLELRKQGSQYNSGGGSPGMKSSSPGMRQSASPGLRRTVANNTPTIQAPQGISSLNQEAVYISNLLIRLGHSLDVLTPLDKQLANSQKNNHFGINFLSTYMGNNEELRFSDFIKEEFCLEKDKSQVKSLGRQS